MHTHTQTQTQTPHRVAGGLANTEIQYASRAERDRSREDEKSSSTDDCSGTENGTANESVGASHRQVNRRAREESEKKEDREEGAGGAFGGGEREQRERRRRTNNTQQTRRAVATCVMEDMLGRPCTTRGRPTERLLPLSPTATERGTERGVERGIERGILESEDELLQLECGHYMHRVCLEAVSDLRGDLSASDSDSDSAGGLAHPHGHYRPRKYCPRCEYLDL